ncbi:alpha/beta fold hydrolase [Pseudomonas sp. NPDC090201]|uniref:alpha/beta fold hydrolase n=1 Tax=Pseudomonas sp. NPDC090201 TaxID=3364475 RepID=UPI00380CB4A3
MFKISLSLALASIVSALSSVSAMADVKPFPASFTEKEIATNGTTLHVRVGGNGPAVVLLHGFADTGDMWQPLAVELAKNHRVIVPDLRGMGLSAHPDDGYDKQNQAKDIAGVLDSLKVGPTEVVAHDIGNMVAYAFTSQYPERVSRLVLMDAPLPGLGQWQAFLLNQGVWHFNFRGSDVERLVAGRERIYLDRFYNEMSYDPSKIDEQTRDHYAALYARPGAIHSAFNQFAAFSQDAIDNQARFAKIGKLNMPVLAIGGEKSFGASMQTYAASAFNHVDGLVVPKAGHWIMEEQPEFVVPKIQAFLDSKN